MKIFGIVKTWVVAHKVAAIAIGAGGAAVIATSVAVPVAVANHKASQEQKEEGSVTPETPETPVDPLTPEQRSNANATYEIMFNLVKEDFGELIANTSKDYILEKAEYVTLKNARAEKLSTYVADGKGVSLSDPSSVFNYGRAIYDDGGVSDAVYFATALSKCYLNASSIAFYKQSHYFTFILSALDEEGEDLPNNAITVINKFYSVCDGANAITISEEFSRIAVSILMKEVLDPDDVKGLLTKASDLVKSLDEVRDNVKYFGNFSKKVLAKLPELFPETPEKAKEFIDALEFNVAIDTVFDVANAFGNKLVSLPDSYYEHLKEIKLPYESYAYAILGVVKCMLPEINIPELSKTQIKAITSLALNLLLNKIESEKEKLGEKYNTIVEIVKDKNVKDLISGLIKLVLDAAKYETSILDFESVCHAIGVFYDGFKVSYSAKAVTFYSLEDLEEANLPKGVSLDVSKLEEAIENREEDYYFESSDNRYVGNPTEVEAEELVKTFDIVEYDYVLEYVIGESEEEDNYSVSVSYVVTTVEYKTLTELAQYVYDILDEIVEADNYRDALVDDLREIGLAASALFDDYFDLLPLDEDKKAEVVAVKDIVDLFLKSDEAITIIKSAGKNAFVVLRNLLLIFFGEEVRSNLGELIAVATYYDLSDPMSLLTIASFFMQKYEGDELDCLGTLLEEIYDLAALAGLNGQLVNAVADLLSKVELLSYLIDFDALRSADSAESFRSIVFDGFLKMILVSA